MSTNVISKVAGIPEITASDVVEGGSDVNIQAAIDGLTSGRTSKEKIVLRGDFTVTATITVPSYTVIEVYGTLTCTNDITNAGMIKNADSTNTDIEIIGGFWDVDNTTTAWDRYGILMSGVSRLTIRDTHVIDSGTHCIDIKGCDEFYIENNLCENAADDGISILYSYNGRISNNHINGGANNAAGGAGSSGIEIEDGSHDLTISNNVIDGITDNSASGIHVIVDPAAPAGCYGLTISNNITKNNAGRGIGVINNKVADAISDIGSAADATGEPAGEGTVYIKSVGHGMTADSTWKVIIEGVDDTSGNLIPINGEHVATYVDADIISIVLTVTGTYDAASSDTINYDHNNITIVGNVSELDSLAGAHVANSRNISITGNSINRAALGSSSGAINIGGVKYSQVVGNAVANCGYEGVRVDTASDNVLIEGNTIRDCAVNIGNQYAILVNTATNTTIIGNQCIDTRATTVMYGISSLAGGTNRLVYNEVASTKTAGAAGEKISWTAGDVQTDNQHHGRVGVGGAGAQVIGDNYNFIKLTGTTQTTATIADAALQNNDTGIVTIKCTGIPTTTHTVTLTSGTFDGTTTIATFDAINDEIVVYFNSEGDGTVISNTSVVLS